MRARTSAETGRDGRGEAAVGGRWQQVDRGKAPVAQHLRRRQDLTEAVRAHGGAGTRRRSTGGLGRSGGGGLLGDRGWR
jgi:hypothetical protein